MSDNNYEISGDNMELNEEEVIEKFCCSFPLVREKAPRLLASLANIFLNFRRFNYDEAVSRFENYVTWREEVLGGFREDESMCEHHEKIQKQLESGFLRVLPHHLPDGSALVYLELRKHNTSVYSATDTLRAWHSVVIGALLQNPDLAKKGFVVMSNMEGVGLSNLDVAIPTAIASAVSNCMPVRMVNALVINPPWVAQFIIPIMKLLLSQKLGKRLNLVTDLSVLQSEFDLPPTHLPQELGGALPID